MKKKLPLVLLAGILLLAGCGKDTTEQNDRNTEPTTIESVENNGEDSDANNNVSDENNNENNDADNNANVDLNDIQEAATDLTNILMEITNAIQNGTVTMDEETAQKFTEISTGISEMGQDMVNNPTKYLEQENINELNAKIADYKAQLNEIKAKIGLQ